MDNKLGEGSSKLSLGESDRLSCNINKVQCYMSSTYFNTCWTLDNKQLQKRGQIPHDPGLAVK